MDGKTLLFIVLALIIIGAIIGSGKPPSNGPNDGWGGSGPVK